MNTLDLAKKQLQDQIAEKQRQLAFLEGLSAKLSQLEINPSFCGNSLDFDYLKHTDVIKVVRAIGGKWNKKPNVGNPSKIDYVQTIGEFEVRCYQGEPPPNCKLVDVEEIIPAVPAQPERKVIRKKLVCVDAPAPSDNPSALRKLVLENS